MRRDYISGAYLPLIGYLKENVSVSIDDLKARYVMGATKDKVETREKHFHEWLNKVVDDHVVSIEYDTVTFDESQWNRISKMDD